MNESDANDLVTALFDRCYRMLVRYALRTTRNYELAEDLAQDTFTQLCEALKAGKSIEDPKAWMFCVLRRSLGRKMKENNRNEPLDESDLGAQPVAEVPGLAEILDFVSVLSPREEEAVMLRLESLKYREIGDQLGISVNSVNALLMRAVRKLHDAISKRANEERGK